MVLRNRIFLTLSWSVLILVLLLWPMPEYEAYGVSYYDKIVHVFIFGFLAFLLSYTLRAVPRYNWQTRLFVSSFFSIIYAGLGEYLQLYAPGRMAGELDFIAGVGGVIFAQIIIYLRYERKRA